MLRLTDTELLLFKDVDYRAITERMVEIDRQHPELGAKAAEEIKGAINDIGWIFTLQVREKNNARKP